MKQIKYFCLNTTTSVFTKKCWENNVFGPTQFIRFQLELKSLVTENINYTLHKLNPASPNFCENGLITLNK